MVDGAAKGDHRDAEAEGGEVKSYLLVIVAVVLPLSLYRMIVPCHAVLYY